MAERMKRARLVVLRRCGHWTPVERADDCMRELRDFLGSQR
jgi:pimeloyl-ACP methyl ester carboxylesterase